MRNEQTSAGSVVSMQSIHIQGSQAASTFQQQSNEENEQAKECIHECRQRGEHAEHPHAGQPGSIYLPAIALDRTWRSCHALV